jgi:hypothetical protein
VAEFVDAIESDNERAHRHLRLAWGRSWAAIRTPPPPTGSRSGR